MSQMYNENVEINDIDNSNDTVLDNNFNNFIQNENFDQNKTLIIIFDIDSALFEQKNKYTRDIKFDKISLLGCLYQDLIEKIKEISKNVYLIGITNAVFEKYEFNVLKKNNINFNIIVSRSKRNNNLKHKLQNKQVALIEKFLYSHNITHSISVINNDNLSIKCLEFSSFVINIKVYENKTLLIPIICTFIKNYKSELK